MSVSVCLITYNGSAYIHAQINSILPQLNASDELLVSDDGSVDGTVSIIHAFNDERIKIYHHQDVRKVKNGEGAAFVKIARNMASILGRAAGEYIFLSDQDDVWKPNKVETMVSMLQNNDFVFCNYDIIDADGAITQEKVMNELTASFSVLQNLFNFRLIGCCIAFRKELLRYILPFPRHLVGHDLWISSLAAVFGKCAYIDTPLHLYRRYCNNVSAVEGKSKNSLLFKIRYRIYFLVTLVTRICSARLFGENKMFSA